MRSPPLTLCRLASPLGELLLVAGPEGVLLASDYSDCAARLHRLLTRRIGAFGLQEGAVPPFIADAISAYFAGEVTAIDRIALRFNGSAFQNLAWQALRQIPPGRPVSYREQAARIAGGSSARAVGSANRSNPYNLVLPCHRVIGADGSLTGYAGGLARKRWLLDHEARHAPG